MAVVFKQLLNCLNDILFMLTEKGINRFKKRVERRHDRLPVIFDALGDQGRFRIFKLLMVKHDFCVSDIAAVMGITASAASQQLKILEMVGLVQKERMGKMICYKLRDDDAIVKLLAPFFA